MQEKIFNMLKSLEYKLWVKQHYPNAKAATGQCHQAAKAMVKEFPELRLARGFVSTPDAELTHWWCVDQEGDVIDPTRHQFPLVFWYTEISDDHPLAKYPMKKCMNCGEMYLQSEGHSYDPACDEYCFKELNESLS
jgi:hypothetical protein